MSEKNTAANMQHSGMTVSAEEEIDLVEIFYLMIDNIVKIVACLLVGAVIAFAGTRFLITPKYQATARMYIVSASNNSVVNISDLNLGSALRADYKELLKSRTLLEDVIDDLDLSEQYTYRNLQSMISVVNPTDTRILNINVTTADPVLSADIANSLVNQAKIYLPDVMKTDEPSIYEYAIVPTSKSSPSYSKNTMIGGLLGALLCMGILIIKYLMNDTILTPDDVYKYFGVQPLAVIPEGNLGEFNEPRQTGRKRSKKETKE